MPENDLTKPSADGPEDTRPLFERAIKEMILTREMLIERFDRLESRVVMFEQSVNERFDRLETQIRLLDHKFEEMVIDIANVRGAQRGLDKRVTELERKPA